MSGRVYIEDTILTKIADDLRTKFNEDTKYSPDDMIDRLGYLNNNIFDSIIGGSIENLNNSDLVTLKNFMFTQTRTLKTVYLPNLTTLGTTCFRYCTSLTTVRLPKITSINILTFNGCSTLDTVILESPILCSISNINVFSDTPIAKGTGYVYVPKALVSQYKAATNWITYANAIRAIEDFPNIIGGV